MTAIPGSNPKEPVEILLVDDKIENLMSIEELLAEDGLVFVRALSGEEALEHTLKSRPALIMLDVQMPGMTGFEVARLLRGMERTRDIPIIFVTATHREERFAFEGFESGAVDYLFKPLNPVIVRSKVRVFVELHRKSTGLEKAVRELSLINHELESFSYSVSHDLRAPLRAIIGFTNEVLEDLDGSESGGMKDRLGRISAAGQRMNHLIDAILSLSRITRSEFSKLEVDVSEIGRRICDELSHENPSRKVKFEIPEGISALADKRLLEVVLQNLFHNAYKFTAKCAEARIEFGMKEEEGERIYFVRDNGAGFDMKYAGKLFGAFQRLHSETEFQGTGIGLATVQRAVHRHGGRIWAESKVKEGSTFYFTL